MVKSFYLFIYLKKYIYIIYRSWVIHKINQKTPKYSLHIILKWHTHLGSSLFLSHLNIYNLIGNKLKIQNAVKAV